jgi:hypothetical protein
VDLFCFVTYYFSLIRGHQSGGDFLVFPFGFSCCGSYMILFVRVRVEIDDGVSRGGGERLTQNYVAATVMSTTEYSTLSVTLGVVVQI